MSLYYLCPDPSSRGQKGLGSRLALTLVLQARPNQPQHGSLSALRTVRDTKSDPYRAGIGWVWLARLALTLDTAFERLCRENPRMRQAALTVTWMLITTIFLRAVYLLKLVDNVVLKCAPSASQFKFKGGNGAINAQCFVRPCGWG